MKKIITLGSLVLVLFALSAPAQEAAETVEFKAAQPAKGQKFVTATAKEMDMNIEATMADHPPFQMSSRNSETSVSEAVVLEVGEKGATRIRFTLKRFESSEKQSMMGRDNEKSESDARLGGTFVVAIEDGKLAVADPEGGEVDAEVKSRFEEKLGRALGRGRLVEPARGLDLALAGRKVAVGEELAMPRESVRQFLDGVDKEGQAEPEVKKATLKLLRRTTYLGIDCGEFEIKISLAGDIGDEGQKLDLAADLEGKVLVGLADTWLYKAELGGPMTMKSAAGGHQGLAMDGKGNMKLAGNLIVSRSE